jgi:hypothetical protein
VTSLKAWQLNSVVNLDFVVFYSRHNQSTTPHSWSLVDNEIVGTTASIRGLKKDLHSLPLSSVDGSFLRLPGAGTKALGI